MTEKEKYDLLLSELAEKLKEKNDTISLQNYKIANLEQQLKAAEVYLPTKTTLEIRSKK